MGMYCDVYAATPAELQKLLAAPDTISDFLESEQANAVSLEKAWHGLHFFLTGSVWEGEGVLNFIAVGGDVFGDPRGGDVNTRYLPPDAVAQLDAALSPISDDELWSRFDPAKMEAEGIYPGIWDEPEEDLREEYLMYFGWLKNFVGQAHQDGKALIIHIG